MGTRPEAIKMAPVVRALTDVAGFEPIVVSTGQHREMLAQVVDLFGIHVDRDLDVMRPNQSLAGLTSRLLTSIDGVLSELNPDLTLVQGDTTTVLAGSLACFYQHRPIGHVEAGLRTGNLGAPFPEEANRVLTGRLASWHYAPTDRAAEALLNEGVPQRRVFVTGNTVIDALRMEVARQSNPEVQRTIRRALAEELGEGFEMRRFVLITGHRRENFGSGFEEICQAIKSLAKRFPDTDFVYPVHLNPNVVGPVNQLLGDVKNIRLIRPQPYDRFVSLLSSCHFVLTDSGGVQEEAPGLGKPVLVMRSVTERPEGITAGTVALVGATSERIQAGVSMLLTDESRYQAMSTANNPYGDGKAGPRIVDLIRQHARLGLAQAS